MNQTNLELTALGEAYRKADNVARNMQSLKFVTSDILTDTKHTHGEKLDLLRINTRAAIESLTELLDMIDRADIDLAGGDGVRP